MKATELRLGNLFYFDCDKLPNGKLLCYICDINHLKVVGLSFIDKSALITNYVYKIESIPLTEEWLIKFGFKNHVLKKYKNDVGLWRKGKVSIYWQKNKGFRFSGKGIKIKYIHQLQNLYFTLTGEELKLI